MMFGPGANNFFSDRRIIDVLAAPEPTHRRLLRTAKMVPEILAESGDDALCARVELYGSLALDLTEPDARSNRLWCQEWSSYYVNGQSDVDFVVEMRRNVAPDAILQALLKKGPWRLVGQVQVHKFASMQYTLVGQIDEDGVKQDVYLDVTCVEQPLHFSRFKSRQEAFRAVFTDVRLRMEAQYAVHGALAFDAYVHLLKAFAAKVPGNALTGYQATCIGLFTLQVGFFRLTPTQSLALTLFEGFLRFCVTFYGDAPAAMNFRTCAIDLSSGGGCLPRMNQCWRSELYFMTAESQMQVRPEERMNVAHSLDPPRVAAEARLLLERAFSNAVDWNQCQPNGSPAPAPSPGVAI